jgi:hypothetical protein
MIGIKGTLKETEEILVKVKECLSLMDLTLSDTKTKITNLNSSEAVFLGTIIKRARKYSYSRPSHNLILRRNSRKLRLEAPITRIIKKLHHANFMKNNKSSPKFV